MIDKILNEVIKNYLPIWINREELIYDLRRQMPQFILAGKYFRNTSNGIVYSIFRYLDLSITNRDPTDLNNFSNFKTKLF